MMPQLIYNLTKPWLDENEFYWSLCLCGYLEMSYNLETLYVSAWTDWW